MAKMKFDFKKIDLTKVKQFLLDKGEKVVLGVVLVIGVLTVGLGLWGAMNSNGKQTAEQLRKDTDALRRALTVAVASKDPPKDDPLPKTAWNIVSPWFPFRDLIASSDPDLPRRNNPTVLPVLVGDREHMAMAPSKDGKWLIGGNDSVRFAYSRVAALQQYDVEGETVAVLTPVTATGKGPAPDKTAPKAPFDGPLVETLAQKKMLIVSCFFPMELQVSEFCSALRLSKEDVKKELPQILGVNIMRVDRYTEFDETEKKMVEKVVETPLYWSGKFEDSKLPDAEIARLRKLVSPHTGVALPLDEFLRKVRLDEDALKPFALHRLPGLMTNMPKLANVSYPSLDHKDFKEKVEKKPKTVDKAPIVKDAKDKDAKKHREGNIDRKDWKELDSMDVEAGSPRPADAKYSALVRRFRGLYSPFDGQEALNRENEGKVVPPGGVRPGFQPGFPPGAVAEKPEPIQYDPLIRFFDVDLEPGHTYEYKIQVRMKNPNYNKKDDVAIATDAEIYELPPSEWKTTPAFKVPLTLDETRIYAVDQWERRPPYPCGPDHADLYDRVKKTIKPLELQEVPFQIQRWIGEADAGTNKYVVADWVVAERVLVRRGEYIGRKNLPVLAVSWSGVKDDFEVVKPSKAATQDKDGNVIPPTPGGLKLDFTVPDTMLVDFDGGPKPMKKAGGSFVSGGQVNIEESALDMLILQPDGKLIVRNSHKDFNDKARMEVEKAYRERIAEFIVRPTEDEPAVNPKDPPMKKKIFGGP